MAYFFGIGRPAHREPSGPKYQKAGPRVLVTACITCKPKTLMVRNVVIIGDNIKCARMQLPGIVALYEICRQV